MAEQGFPLSRERGQQLLFKSASDGDLDQITSLLDGKQISDIDIRDHQGWTALMFASRNGHTNIVKYLIQFGANIQLVNKSGHTAHQIAEFWSHTECCESIRQWNANKTKQSPSSEVVNFFGKAPLDRLALHRGDESWLDATMKDSSAKYILLSKQSVYAMPPSADNRKYSLCSYSYDQVNQLMNDSEKNRLPVILLGSDGLGGNRKDGESEVTNKGTSAESGSIWFAVDVTTVDSGELEKLNPEAELMGSNVISLMGFDENQAAILAQAISILLWHDRYKYCPTCGSNTVMEEAGYKRKCENADCRSQRGVHNTNYPRLDPVAIMLVIHPDGDKCLLGRKKMFPKGMYSCLAGFMEPGESLEDSVRREVKEESGIDIGRVQYHSSQPWPMPSQIMIGCHAWATSTDITLDQQELEEAKWFSRQEVFEAVIHGHKGYTERGGNGIFVPPHQAIAHQLIKAWATTSANL